MEGRRWVVQVSLVELHVRFDVYAKQTKWVRGVCRIFATVWGIALAPLQRSEPGIGGDAVVGRHCLSFQQPPPQRAFTMVPELRRVVGVMIHQRYV